MNERHIKEEGLRDWFGKSKSKDGKSGWVNVVTGDSCASDKPGEGIPKCVSSAKRASMSKKERRSAAAAKRRKDPGQQQKTGAAKPTMVSTDPKKKMKVSESHYGASVNKIPDELDKAVKMHKSQAKRLRDSEVFKKDAGKTANKIPSQLDKAVALHTKQAKELRAAGVSEDKNCGCGQTPCKTYGEKKMDEEKFVPPYKELKTFAKEKEKKKSRMNAEETEIVEAKDKKGKGSGTKDACYHKVKSRYRVWPSAYASGALVKCRKVGAANWGNKSKKNESVDYSNWRDEFIPTEYETTDLIKADPIKASPSNLLKINEKKDIPADVKKIAGELDAAVKMHKSQAKRLRKAGISEENLDEKCWKGYEKKGMKTMFGKRYPNCVKKKKTRKEEVELKYDKSKKSEGKYNMPTVKAPGNAVPMPEYKPRGTKKPVPMPNYKPEGEMTEGYGVAPNLDPKVPKSYNERMKDAREKSKREGIFLPPWIGPELPRVKAKSKIQVSHYEPEGEMVSERSRLDGPEERKKDLDKRYDPKGGGKNPYQYIPVKKAQVQKEAKSDGDPCWDTHEMKGMKKKGNRMVPNCVRKEQVSDWRSELDLQEKEFKSHKMYDPKTGKGYDAETEEDHLRMKKMGYTHEKPEKKNCGCGKDPCETYGKKEVKEDWQKSNRKDGVDGMSQSSVNAYKRENPGSKLKTAVTGKVKKGSKDAKRRKSFCSRSKGQKDMHNIDCSKTPDKKICKARKRWRC